MTIEHLKSDVLVKILPLNHDFREYGSGGFHELVDYCEVSVAA
jgi:hypothetical protein